jgi:outer membrane protein assembly factor BamB
MNVRGLSLLVGAWCFAGFAAAGDWPQWRGPERNGISTETGLLQKWPKEGPKLLWHVTDLDAGYSTPAVVGDRLYVLNNKGKDTEYLQARQISDGKSVWNARVGKVGPNQMMQYPGSRSTPTADGAMVYALGSDGDLVCV